MGKVKDEQMFTLLRNFLLIYLPNQRRASTNTVKAYRTAWNQLLKYISGQKKIPMMSVTFEMINYESVNSYLDWLTKEKKAGSATRNNRLAAILLSVKLEADAPVTLKQCDRKHPVRNSSHYCLCILHIGRNSRQFMQIKTQAVLKQI